MCNESYNYHVYGLPLCANRPIPGLLAVPSGQTLDVQVRLGRMPHWINQSLGTPPQTRYVSTSKHENGEPALMVWSPDGSAHFRLRYGDGTEFIVDRAGTEVWATWPDTLTLEDTVTYLLGPILGLVLRLRGTTCLHASAIAMDDRAIVLLGQAGAGKSTTAAAFAELDYPVLSDDIVPLRAEGDSFLVLPGYPNLRLWPASVETLYGSSEALPRLTPTWDKRCLDLTTKTYRFQRHPLPLAAIYVLGQRSTDPAAPFVESVPAAHGGLITLIANTYGNRLLDKAMQAQDLELLSRVIEHVPLRQVTPHENPAYLFKLCHAILDDFRVSNASPPVVQDSGNFEHV